MSGVLSDFAAFFAALRPASFRGAPFHVATAKGAGGRRYVLNEYPLRDGGFPEDLGQLAQKFSVKAYLIGPNYTAARDGLLAATQNGATSGTLVLPTVGRVTAQVGEVAWGEQEDMGGYCTVDIEFVRDDGAAAPLVATDTASRLIAGINNLSTFVQNAYATAMAPLILLGQVQGAVQGLLGQAESAFGALTILPGLTFAGLTGTAGNPFDTATMVTACLLDGADGVVDAATTPAPLSDPVNGTQPPLPVPLDPSQGLAGLCGFGATLPPAPMAQPNVAAAQAAVLLLVQGSATMAVLLVYGQINWPSSNAAQAGLAQVQDLTDAMVEAASEANQPDLFRAWRAVAAMAVNDMITRAQNLPTLATYNVVGSLPALTLAQKLLADGTQADALVALNDAPHPLFMPASGVWLEAA